MFIMHTFFHSVENVYVNRIENQVEKFLVLKVWRTLTILESFHAWKI